MDFYSSSYTNPRDDSMSSSLLDHENRIIQDNSKTQQNYYDNQCNDIPTDFQIIYYNNSQNLSQHCEQYQFYAQSQLKMLNEEQNQHSPLVRINDQVIFYNSRELQKENPQLQKFRSSSISSIAECSIPQQKNVFIPIYDQLCNLKNQNPELYHQGKQESQKIKDDNSNYRNYNEIAQINQQKNKKLQQITSTRQTIYLNNGSSMIANELSSNLQKEEESDSSSSEQYEQFTDLEKVSLLINDAQLKGEGSKIKINYQLESHQSESNGNNLELDSNINNKSQRDQITDESLYESNKYPVTKTNNLDVNNIIEGNKDLTSDLAQHQLQITLQSEKLFPREYSFMNILPPSDDQEVSPAMQNKFLIEGGVLIDLNEFDNPDLKDTRIKTISQFYSFTQLQKFKKYIVANLELKSLPQKNFSEIISRLQQYNEKNEKAARLTASLFDYQQYFENRKSFFQEQIPEVISAISIQDNTKKNSQKLECGLPQFYSSSIVPPQGLSHTELQQGSSTIVLDNQNHPLSIFNMVDPYYSPQRANYNLRQADKILKQFEKYCFTFHILRKSPIQIEQLQMGISTSFIELVGLNPNDTISSSLRNIQQSILPFDYAGLDPSEYSIDQIYQIITSVKEKQKHYNRKQSLQYGELKHSCGKNVKVKIQSKVFLLNTYSPLNSNPKGNQNNNFNEDFIGDYLELKLYTPETIEVQKISKKRVSSTRQGALSKEDCQKIDENERKSAYFNNVQIFLDKFYNDETLLSPDLIFRKKWAIKSSKHNE